ncbi:hypothetical protein WJX74_005728 [Apatococcus lobatus]|uniref:Uncharacterized protein n=1 Tax=Apatococcus lobatus TaxID=904363 RepID=A0AAW1Q979_9CHLO
MSWTSFSSFSHSLNKQKRQPGAVKVTLGVQSPGTSSFAYAAVEAAQQEDHQPTGWKDQGDLPEAAQQLLPGQMQSGVEQQLNGELHPDAAHEAAQEAALLQQAATKWTRTACWAAQDSVHAAMPKRQVESLSGMSITEDDVSNSALLHLELKVARKKLEQQESRTVECEGVISRLHQQLASAQEAQVSAQGQLASLQDAAQHRYQAAAEKLQELQLQLQDLQRQHAAKLQEQQHHHDRVLSEVKAGHASKSDIKMTELASQLADTRAAKEQLEEQLTTKLEEVSARLASEKRRCVNLKVQLDADKENEQVLQTVRQQSEQGLHTSLQRLQKMIDGERKKAAKAAAEANDAMEAERGRSREALRALQQQTQESDRKHANALHRQQQRLQQSQQDTEFNQKKAASLQQHLQESEAAKLAQELKLQQAEGSLKSLQTTLAGLSGQLAAREQSLQAYLKDTEQQHVARGQELMEKQARIMSSVNHILLSTQAVLDMDKGNGPSMPAVNGMLPELQLEACAEGVLERAYRLAASHRQNLEALQKAMQDKGQLEGKGRELQELLDLNKLAAAEATAQNDSLQQQLNECKAMAVLKVAEVQSLTAANAALQASLSQIEEENAQASQEHARLECTSACERAAGLAAELEAKDCRLRELRTAIAEANEDHLQQCRSQQQQLAEMTTVSSKQKHAEAELSKELSHCRAQLQQAQASMDDLQQAGSDSQLQAAALQADMHAISAALADLTCTVQSCSLKLQQAEEQPQTQALSQPKAPVGDGAAEDYLVRQAGLAKTALQHVCDAVVSAMKEAASLQLQAEHQSMQSSTSIQEATQAMRQFVLPSLSADLSPSAVDPAGPAADTGAEVLRDLVQHAVVASAGMANQLQTARAHAHELKAAETELQGIQGSLRTELENEQGRLQRLQQEFVSAQAEITRTKQSTAVDIQDLHRLAHGKIHQLQVALAEANKAKTDALAQVKQLQEQLGEETSRSNNLESLVSEVAASKSLVDADLAQQKTSATALKKQLVASVNQASRLEVELQQESARANAASGTSTRLQGQLAQARSMAQKASADAAQQRSAAPAAAAALADAACADLKRQVTSLRQQLKLSNSRLQTAEDKYATHASSMATAQSRAEFAEKSAQQAQADLSKLQAAHEAATGQHMQQLSTSDSILQEVREQHAAAAASNSVLQNALDHALQEMESGLPGCCDAPSKRELAATLNERDALQAHVDSLEQLELPQTGSAPGWESMSQELRIAQQDAHAHQASLQFARTEVNTKEQQDQLEHLKTSLQQAYSSHAAEVAHLEAAAASASSQIEDLQNSVMALLHAWATLMQVLGVAWEQPTHLDMPSFMIGLQTAQKAAFSSVSRLRQQDDNAQVIQDGLGNLRGDACDSSAAISSASANADFNPGSISNDYSMAMIPSDNQLATGHFKELALVDNDPSAHLPAGLLENLLMRQGACVSFMKALSSLLQPASGNKVPDCTTIAASSDMLEQSLSASLQHDVLTAENLDELASKARAAVVATLASCQKTVSDMRADIIQRDQHIRRLQHEAAAYDMEALAAKRADDTQREAALSNMTAREQQAREIDSVKLVDALRMEVMQLKEAIAEHKDRYNTAAEQITALETERAQATRAVDKSAPMSFRGLEQPLSSRTVSQLLQAAAKCKDLELRCSMLEQQASKAHLESVHEIQLAAASEHQAQAQMHALEKIRQSRFSEHEQQQEALQQELAALHSVHHELHSQYEQHISANDKDVQCLQADLEASNGIQQDLHDKLQMSISCQQHLQADLETSQAIGQQLEEQLQKPSEEMQQIAAKQGRVIAEYEQQLQALEHQINGLQGDLDMLKAQHEQQSLASATGQRNLQADLDASIYLERQLQQQLQSASADNERLMAEKSRLPASVTPLEDAIEQCSTLSSILQQQQAMFDVNDEEVAQALKASESRCQQLVSKLQIREASHDFHTEQLAQKLQAAENRCQQLVHESQEQQARHHVDDEEHAAHQQLAVVQVDATVLHQGSIGQALLETQLSGQRHEGPHNSQDLTVNAAEDKPSTYVHQVDCKLEQVRSPEICCRHHVTFISELQETKIAAVEEANELQVQVDKLTEQGSSQVYLAVADDRHHLTAASEGLLHAAHEDEHWKGSDAMGELRSLKQAHEDLIRRHSTVLEQPAVPQEAQQVGQPVTASLTATEQHPELECAHGPGIESLIRAEEADEAQLRSADLLVVPRVQKAKLQEALARAVRKLRVQHDELQQLRFQGAEKVHKSSNAGATACQSEQSGSLGDLLRSAAASWRQALANRESSIRQLQTQLEAAKDSADQKWIKALQQDRDVARTLARKLQAQLAQKQGEAEELEAAVQAARQSSRGGGELAIVAHQRLQQIYRLEQQLQAVKRHREQEPNAASHEQQIAPQHPNQSEQVLELKAELRQSMQEGKELRRMLAAWEALRLGKDAQIAALLRHCTAAEPDPVH